MSYYLAVGDGLSGWLWDRHANLLSWYIRPLFLIPLAWFAYRRSVRGLVVTVVGLATSMAWFPAPAVPDPRVLEFLAFEQEWLGGGWSVGKIALTSLVPLSLAAYCLAFWRRSLLWGLVVLNAMALGKILWSLVLGDGGGAVVVPALIGLVLGDAVLLLGARWLRTRSAQSPTTAAAVL